MTYQTRILTAEEYDALDAINYSTLSQMKKDPKNLTLTKEQKRINFNSNPAMKLGALVDCMGFSPRMIDKLYYFATTEEPGDKMGELMVNYLASKGPLAEIDIEILTASREATGFQSNWGMPAVLKNFTEKCQPFFFDLTMALDRAIISPSLKAKASKAITSLLTCPYFGLSDIFQNETGMAVTKRFTFDGYESDWNILYQTGIAFEISSFSPPVLCKGKTDIILISRELKLVYIIDLKVTSNPPRDFRSNWLSWNYQIQAAMYHEAVACWLDEMGIGDYEIRFMFLVAHPEYQPVFWNMPKSLITFGRNGGDLYSGTHIPGLLELIEQYQWHQEKQIFDYTPDEYGMKNNLTLRIL